MKKNVGKIGALLLLFCAFILNSSSSFAQKECVRLYKVTIANVTDIPAGCTGTVTVKVNGTLYSQPFVAGQATYYFDEIDFYPQTVCPDFSLNCGISPQNKVCSYIPTRFSCGTYTLYTLTWKTSQE
jgi:hypothetical protein